MKFKALLVAFILLKYEYKIHFNVKTCYNKINKFVKLLGEIMGTRNLTVVVSEGQTRVAQYGQFDGYIEGQGVTCLEFLRDKMNSTFKEKLLQCSWITDEEYDNYMVECGAKADAEWVSIEVSDRFKERYFHLHRDCASNVLELIQNSSTGLQLQDAVNFAADPVFCEWAYVIDLDKNTFEVYTSNDEELTKNDRFYYLTKDSENGNDAVKMVKSYSLYDLPTNEQFVHDFKKDDDSEEND